MTVKNLWDCFCEYPDRLNYYDESKNIEDTITNQEEMSNFINENEDKEVIEWNYGYSDNELYVYIGEEE